MCLYRVEKAKIFDLTLKISIASCLLESYKEINSKYQMASKDICFNSSINEDPFSPINHSFPYDLFDNDDPILENVMSENANKCYWISVDQNLGELTLNVQKIQIEASDVLRDGKEKNSEEIITNSEDKENFDPLINGEYGENVISIFPELSLDQFGHLMNFEDDICVEILEENNHATVDCCRKHEKYAKKKLSLMTKMPKKIMQPLLNFCDLFTKTETDKYLKPKFSHNMLCAFAIWSHPQRGMEVSHIYRFLSDSFPYFKTAGLHWKNSLRHSLATCDWFLKSDYHRTAKKGYTWFLNDQKTNCLKFEIKKQCVKDVTKLYHTLAGPHVCTLLYSMGLLEMDVIKYFPLNSE